MAFRSWLLATASTVVTPDSWKSVIDVLTAQLSVSTIVGVIASVFGITVGFAFMWWGIRYATAKIMKGAKRGKV